MKRVGFVLLILSIFFISGCSLKVVERGVITYGLDSSTKTFKSIKIPKVLKISTFKSSENLQSDKIWYKRGFEENSYTQSKWRDGFKNMIENSVKDILVKSSIFKSVIGGYSKAKADIYLEGDILKSYQDISKSNEVVFDMVLYLIGKDKKLISFREFSYRVKCDTLNAKGAVKAYNKIVNKMDKEVVKWIKESIRKN